MSERGAEGPPLFCPLLRCLSLAKPCTITFAEYVKAFTEYDYTLNGNEQLHATKRAHANRNGILKISDQ